MNPDYPTYNPKHKKHTISYVLLIGQNKTKRFTPTGDGKVTITIYDENGKLISEEVYLEKAARGIWEGEVLMGSSRSDDIKNLPNHVNDYLVEYMKKSHESIKDIYEDGDLLEMRIDPTEFYKKQCKEACENYALNA
jgi:hypothetical protein